MTDQRDAADALGDAIDEIHRLETELTELRALKAKVDGCTFPTDKWVVTNERGHRLLFADDLLTWLRETTDD